MIFKVFAFYFALIILIFPWSKLRQKNKRINILPFIIIPGLFGLIMAMLTIIKVYFIYKIFLLFFFAITLFLSYRQWGSMK